MNAAHYLAFPFRWRAGVALDGDGGQAGTREKIIQLPDAETFFDGSEEAIANFREAAVRVVGVGLVHEDAAAGQQDAVDFAEDLAGIFHVVKGLIENGETGPSHVRPTSWSRPGVRSRPGSSSWPPPVSPSRARLQLPAGGTRRVAVRGQSAARRSGPGRAGRLRRPGASAPPWWRQRRRSAQRRRSRPGAGRGRP